MFFFKIIIFLLFAINIYAKDDFVVAVSKESKINRLLKNDIAKIFLSKIKSFPDGNRAIPLEINDKELQAIFYKQITNKNKKQLLKYWAKMIFTGKGIPPKKFEKIKELLEFVKQNKNAITYLKKEDINQDLKIVWELN